jgi:hypothetical protein
LLAASLIDKVKGPALRPMRTWLSALMIAVGGMGVCPAALGADDGDRLMVQYGPNAIHYSHSPDHAKQSWLVGAEYLWANHWLAGFAYFNNSFDQKSQYVYGGYTWNLTDDPARYWYFKLTGGLIIGYRDPYQNKIPINDDGIGLGAAPSLGYQYDRFNVQLNVLGTAGLMFTVGYDLID